MPKAVSPCVQVAGTRHLRQLASWEQTRRIQSRRREDEFGEMAETYCCDVAQLILLAGQDLAHDTTHNLARSCLGQVWNNKYCLWRCEWSNRLAHLQNQVLLDLFVGFSAVLEGNKGVDGLACQLVVNANDRGFGDRVCVGQ